MSAPENMVWHGRKLHLGCGDKHLPAPWTNSDSCEAPLIGGRVCLSPDVILDVEHDLGAIPAGSLSHVYWSHGVEHLCPDVLPRVLGQLRAALAPGGVLTLATIDLAGIFREYQKGAPAAVWNSYLYGDAKSTDRPCMGHRQCFDAASLSAHLIGAGFSAARPWTFAAYPELRALGDCALLCECLSVFVEGVR